MPICNLKSWGENPVSEWLAGRWGGQLTVGSPYRTVGSPPWVQFREGPQDRLPNTCKLLSTIQLVSKSSSSSPNGLMSCSATLGRGEALKSSGRLPAALLPALELWLLLFPCPKMPLLPDHHLQSQYVRAPATHTHRHPHTVPFPSGH